MPPLCPQSHIWATGEGCWQRQNEGPVLPLTLGLRTLLQCHFPDSSHRESSHAMPRRKTSLNQSHEGTKASGPSVLSSHFLPALCSTRRGLWSPDQGTVGHSSLTMEAQHRAGGQRGEPEWCPPCVLPSSRVACTGTPLSGLTSPSYSPLRQPQAASCFQPLCHPPSRKPTSPDSAAGGAGHLGNTARRAC